MLVDINAAKAHLRLEPNYPNDQVLVYLGAACSSAASFLNRRLFSSNEELAEAIASVPAMLQDAAGAYAAALKVAGALEDGVSRQAAREFALDVYENALRDAREIRAGLVINDGVRAAILLTCGHLFQNREDTVAVQSFDLPLGSRSLLQPYRIGLGV